MDANGGLSNSDVALLADRNDGFGGNSLSSLIWLVAILGFFGGGIGGFGNRGGGPGFVTNQDLALSQNAQTQVLQNQDLFNQIAENKYDIAQAISNQTNTLEINAIQGFNNLSGQITNQTNVLSQQIQALSAQMNQCCCDIKTQMLQDRLTDAQAKIVAQQGEISNAQQTQTILNTLGRFVAWAGSGSQSAVTAG